MTEVIKGFTFSVVGLFVALLITAAALAQEATPTPDATPASDISQPALQPAAEKSRAELNAECALKYECRPVREYYWYGCFYDSERGDCRCFVGDLGQCRAEKSSVNVSAQDKKEEKESEQPTGAASISQEPGKKGKLGIILAIALVAFLFIVSRALDKDNARNNFARARQYHKIAEDHHLRGNGKKAKHYYEQAQKFRKKAEEQL